MSAPARVESDDIALARAARAATRRVPGVVDISRGRFAIARTFGLGGEAVEGVQLTHEPDGLHVEVHVVAGSVPLLPLAATVRAAVAAAVRALGSPVATVDVWIDALRVEDGAREGEEDTG